MLTELHVRNLGVVEDVSLVLRPGLTVITGETGAGKTLLTEAIRLLTGGRAEAHIVRGGTGEASVDGRFVQGDEERVLTRNIPADGRSRAYVDGRMAPLTGLVDAGQELVDIHGQHAHQALLTAVAQRRALDSYGRVDATVLMRVRKELKAVDAELASLGGDAQTRAREVDLLRFQIDEIDAVGVDDPDEDARLLEEETVLADATAHREAAAGIHDALQGEGGAAEPLAVAVKAAAGRVAFADIAARLTAVSAELDDIAVEAARLGAQFLDDPERLAGVQERRRAIKALQRKYGPAMADVMAFAAQSRDRLDELERHDEVVSTLERRRTELLAELREIEASVKAQRVAAAPLLSTEVEARLHDLALPHARFEVEVEGPSGDDVTFLLGPNPGMPLLPVAKAASGGELARTMLALRLTLVDTGAGDAGPQTLIFDEVDAGIGGEAAVAVGRALGSLARGREDTQVLVVTHLAQVAAFADHHIAVDKQSDGKTTSARVRVVEGAERETELARMLSGQPGSESGRAHARELLGTGAARKGGAKAGRR